MNLQLVSSSMLFPKNELPLPTSFMKFPTNEKLFRV